MPTDRPAALIVENQPFIGMVASDILRESGFDTFHANDAQGAVGLLAAHPEIGVVVTDCDLTGDDGGLEFARRVSRERPGVQLVVTVAGNSLPDGAVPEGARVLRKPYASGDLKSFVGVEMPIEEAFA